MSTEMHAGTDRHRRPQWRVFYRSAEITITSWHVDVDGRRIRIAELRDPNRCLTYRNPVMKLARRNPCFQEIRATVRGRRVVLFGTGDQREFGFVWRALVRAVETDREVSGGGLR